MEEKNDMNEWSEEMWHIWDHGKGIYNLNGIDYEYGFDKIKDLAWLRPKGQDLPVIFSDIKRDNPAYVNGGDQFKAEVETVRMIHNIIKAKDVAGKLASE